MRDWLSRCPKRWVCVLAVAICLLISSCGNNVKRTPGGVQIGEGSDPNLIPGAEPLSRYGNPDSYEVFGQRYHTLKSSKGFRERGIASWYGKDFHGRKTSSGEVYDMYQMTAAHKQLPLPTFVKVSNLENGRSTILRVNDRGPFHDNRIIDLSYAAALKLGLIEKGTAFVSVEAVGSAVDPEQVRYQKAVVDVDHDKGDPLYLQIGAFTERDNAERMLKQVADAMSKKVRIRTSTTGQQSIYRVQIGPIASVGLADQVVETLSKIGISEHHFVAN
ncbi:MAG: septal ring lytic transglycosylase RlpA family protein [Proteobacteria bacterium]|nr:septal ring lytic transglycosylase RlpA family protein [Pseudomonadota bacterium]